MARLHSSDDIFTVPSPTPQQEDDRNYIQLCQRISSRITWMDDLIAELTAADETSLTTVTGQRVRVLYDVAMTTQVDLKQLHLLILRSRGNDHVTRTSQYQRLSTQLQQRLERVTQVLNSRGLDRPADAESSQVSTKSSPMMKDSINLTVSAPSEGSMPPDFTHSLFIKIDESEFKDDPEASLEAYKGVQADLEGIQNLAKFLADEVHNAGEDLSAIESNVRDTLLNTVEAREHVAQARESQRRNRQNLAAFFVIPSLVVTVFLILQQSTSHRQ
eukprot:Blabericola_migrator_1__2577@NODE_1729_length_3908_cov_210_810726_g1116_i0_p3_GENE_NODE_1729_length_3908_cov_210_810726_g1116_i0NODE_1729_length_3908_cov_210_810726_g1116_i0_p3_ORF_typecomplete_len274_score39_04SNARE/PF05739_19/1_3e02SNARE/PF05739_19/1_8e05THOC7/PF05615_13/1e02THOC7/PF05615_13/0_16Fibin/PF15819_5/7_8e02Fibin/PF15819_5/0_2Coiledcoil_56/PF09813_9/0_41COG2/PF06148_11/4_2e02COG2/PF06148_11/1YjcZ/PF13990_6/0_37YjcZ/PF13990_6/4_4e02Prefoldin_3/PF13758_6/4_6e03Prefoldin_3/PF13758_6/3_2